MNKVLIFGLGAAAGSLITWKLIEAKYRKLAEEEIADVVEHYKNKDVNEEKGETKIAAHYVEVDKLDNVKREYTQRVMDLGYADDDAVIITDPGVEKVAPYVISPDEFGEKDGYDTKSFTYYADSVLTDEVDDIVFEPETIIGDALSHFGEYGDNFVFVRNENTECDYEILKHDRTFSEINGEDI